MVGMSTALRLTAAGASVAVVEARRVGGGVTGHSSAKLSALQDLAYSRILSSSGPDAAAEYAALNTGGLEFIRKTVRQHKIECHLKDRPSLSFAETDRGLERLSSELDAMRQAGLPVVLVDDTDLPFAVTGALRLDHQAQFDPVAWARGVAGAVVAGGGQVLERCRVVGIDGFGSPQVRLANGTRIDADRVVLATHLPFLDRAAYFARVKPMTSFAVAGQIEGPMPAGIYLGIDGSTRSISPVPEDGPDQRLLVAGEGYRPGTRDSAVSLVRLTSYFRQRFKVKSLDFQWGAHDLMSFDRLPLIGQMLPFDDRILIATGFSKWGLAAGAGASQVIVDHIEGGETGARTVFNPNRIRPRSAPQFIAHNLDSARRLIGDRLKRQTREVELAPGEGRVVGDGLRQKAVSRDLEGVYREVPASCSHLGCIVAWNRAGQTWDCPCHGSRFAPGGAVIEGPATAPLGDDAD